MNHYELAILNLRRAEEATTIADTEAYLRLALVHAVLAIAWAERDRVGHA